MWSSTLFSLVVLLVAVGLVVGHLRHWRRIEQSQPEAVEYDFRRRQMRRRVQTSTMLGVLAVAIFISPWMNRDVWLFTLYCLAMLVLVVWVAMLAMVDFWATRQHYERLCDSHLAKEARLKAELRRIRASEGNGKSRDDA
jgi:Na+/H+ antiporter NhaD/arsenite permease-like protein